MTYAKIKLTIILIMSVLLLYGCSYSFTGASVPSHLKTIHIPLVKDRSGSGEPNLGDDFTNELIQKFLDDNNLEVTDRISADAILECSILPFQDRAETISGTGETATQRRITMNVKVIYKDLVKKITVIDKNFTSYTTYSSTSDAFQARKDAIVSTIDNLTEDILLGVVSNW